MNTGRALDTVFDPRANSLNAVRLFLAVGVIIWHSFPLSGNAIESLPLRQLMSQIWVDGFFAISGFLIVRSWMRDPNATRYVLARLLRILPAFWVCLIVTAFVIAPSVAGAFGYDNFTYVLNNSALWIFQRGIDGTPMGVPYAGSWNGSLWTLFWEFACYIFVIVLGTLGLLAHRVTLPAIFVVALAITALASAGFVDSFYLTTAARFGLMFFAGALIFQYREKIRVSTLFCVNAAALVTGALWLPDYRIIAALPLAYLLISLGALVKFRPLRFRNDVSYGMYIYAFPVQQSLATHGLADSVAVFAALGIALTLPLATISWFCVEKPAMKLRTRAPRPAPASGPAPVTPRSSASD